MIQVKNPILNGFYPDPSICRVGEDFYLVNSSFTYFPGVPIWHSRNLADWEQIGNILDRNSQLPLQGCGHSEGIFAPTIRYYDGVFYMITTNISRGGNFIVTATRPEGPWSEPYFLGPEAQGIDPSLFIDEDGTCYYVGTRPNPDGVRYNGDWEIWVQKLDLSAMQLIGESHKIWKGALRDVIWPEGPHLYKKDGFYYLMIAEGGTGPNHAVTVARSKQVFGPYENNPNNPILTHRHLGKDYPIVYVGHADLVDDADGNWYLVLLASRRCEGYIGLGRETFLAKVVWEDGWPVVNPGVGKLEELVSLPFESRKPETGKVQTLLPYHENKFDIVMLRNPEERPFYAIDNAIRLKFLPISLKELDNPAYLGFRQLEYHYEAILEMELEELAEGDETGLVILQSNEYHMMFRILGKSEQKTALQVVRCTQKQEQILADQSYSAQVPAKTGKSSRISVKLLMRGHGQRTDFALISEGKEVPLAVDVDTHEMSTEVAGGFVGNTIGVYASSAGKQSEHYADILSFVIRY